jgi:hypothetical protein
MGLFLHETTTVSRSRLSALATVSLIIAATGFLNIIGFLIGPVLAHIALLRLRAARRRGVPMRGRWMAIAALWVSYVTLAAGVVALTVMLVAAYAELPAPPPFHWRDHLHLPPLP